MTEGKDRMVAMQKVLHTLDARFRAEESLPTQVQPTCILDIASAANSFLSFDYTSHRNCVLLHCHQEAAMLCDPVKAGMA